MLRRLMAAGPNSVHSARATLAHSFARFILELIYFAFRSGTKALAVIE